jgi:hypothetical protein
MMNDEVRKMQQKSNYELETRLTNFLVLFIAIIETANKNNLKLT